MYAQNIPAALKVPRVSQRAEVTQRIGFTDVKVVYHSPSVRDRKIWGTQIAPYDGKPFLWRAGANENTIISFTDDVLINGQPLAAGTYGLHMIPSQETFTIIFSKNYTSWGSFFYDETEDALRIQVSPEEAPHREWLTYDFFERERTHAVVALWWEKLKIPFKVEVTDETILTHIRSQLRSSPAFTSAGFSNAANYSMLNNVNHEEALGWIDRALRPDPSFANYNIKVRLLEQSGQPEKALEVLSEAFSVGSPAALRNYARREFRGEDGTKGKLAVEYLRKNHKKAWETDAALGDMSMFDKDQKNAKKHYEKALKKAPDNVKPAIQRTIDRLEG